MDIWGVKAFCGFVCLQRKGSELGGQNYLAFPRSAELRHTLPKAKDTPRMGKDEKKEGGRGQPAPGTALLSLRVTQWGLDMVWSI